MERIQNMVGPMMEHGMDTIRNIDTTKLQEGTFEVIQELPGSEDVVRSFIEGARNVDDDALLSDQLSSMLEYVSGPLQQMAENPPAELFAIAMNNPNISDVISELGYGEEATRAVEVLGETDRDGTEFTEMLTSITGANDGQVNEAIEMTRGLTQNPQFGELLSNVTGNLQGLMGAFGTQ